MTVDRRSRRNAPKLRPRLSPTIRTANDAKQPSGVAVLLLEITNARSLRRELGFARWQNAVLSLIARAKELSSGARICAFSWDAVCLVFDTISISDFEKSFAALEVIECAVPMQKSDFLHFEHITAGAFGSDEIDALERAEQALAEAKLRGHGLLVSSDVSAPLRMQIDLANDLALAAPRGELFVLYQPKVHIRRRAVSSAEALIRWQHPVLGLVMPDAFIGLADETGDMRDITLWTLRQVIADQQYLANTGHSLRIYINISGVLLTDRLFIDAACTLIAENSAKIGFEITETAVIRDPDVAIANLEHCAAMGIALAIDDYGSGLSSLSYLKRLPAKELKIDKMFITQLTSSHRDPLIVRSTIDLAHALDMEVTAEGVETPAALALLTVMGCEMVQGYLISPPLELPAFEQYLSEYQFEALQTSVEPTVHRPASFWKRA